MLLNLKVTLFAGANKTMRLGKLPGAQCLNKHRVLLKQGHYGYWLLCKGSVIVLGMLAPGGWRQNDYPRKQASLPPMLYYCSDQA